MRGGLALLPLTLPAVGLAGLLCISTNPVVDMQWGTMQDVPFGSLPDPGEVRMATLGMDCVQPEGAALEYLGSLVVADLDGSQVRVVDFDHGWSLSQAGTVQIVLTCR